MHTFSKNMLDQTIFYNQTKKRREASFTSTLTSCISPSIDIDIEFSSSAPSFRIPKWNSVYSANGCRKCLTKKVVTGLAAAPVTVTTGSGLAARSANLPAITIADTGGCTPHDPTSRCYRWHFEAGITEQFDSRLTGVDYRDTIEIGSLSRWTTMNGKLHHRRWFCRSIIFRIMRPSDGSTGTEQWAETRSSTWCC